MTTIIKIERTENSRVWYSIINDKRITRAKRPMLKSQFDIMFNPEEDKNLIILGK